MTSAKKLTTIEIVDEFFCPEADLLQSANEMAEELIVIYGWTDIFVRKSSIQSKIVGKNIFHFFDIFGKGEAVEFTDLENLEELEDSKNDSFAAKELNP